MVARRIGDAGIEVVRKMGLRAEGVVIPEVMEYFAVGKDVARRFVLRLVREGYLRRTEKRRRRPAVVRHAAGAGGFIYRTTKKQPRRRSQWANWQTRRRKQARR